jgi:hypothetical protein
MGVRGGTVEISNLLAIPKKYPGGLTTIPEAILLNTIWGTVEIIQGDGRLSSTHYSRRRGT